MWSLLPNAGHLADPDSRCPSTSPILKFDEGPRRCVLAEGHSGKHHAPTSEGRYVPYGVPDYTVTWE